MRYFPNKITLLLSFSIIVTIMINVVVNQGDLRNTEPPRCSRIGQIWISPLDGMELVCVPAGHFIMGAAESDLAAGDDEKPQHRVFLDAFWIDRTEITNADVLRCISAGACHPKIYETTALTYVPYSVHTDWQQNPALIYYADDAEAYCQWAGRRLPTEAEWEKAARGSDSRLYPWGNELDCDHANFYICNHVPEYDPHGPHCGYSRYCRTADVNDYPTGASPYGALNMAGNVWEWVSDFYSPDFYAVSPSDNPFGPKTGEFRVRRGGGSTSMAADLRLTTRASGKGEHYYDGQMGFRCAVNSGF